MHYFDYNATTPCLPEVVQAMMPFFTEKYGQASSGLYPLSWQASAAVEKSREAIAELVGVDPDELIFTSGSTESCFLAIRGVIELYVSAKQGFIPHIISSELEHSAVVEAIKGMEALRLCTVSWVPCDENGIISLESVINSKNENTVLLALMLANNVTGVIQDISMICEWARSERIVTFCDTTQAIGKMSLSFKSLGVDMATISSHKMYGPKGIGALYLRKGRPSLRIQAVIKGGGQEGEIRGGTINVPGVVGFGEAAKCALDNFEKYNEIKNLRDYLEKELYASGAYIWGGDVNRLPHVSMLGFKDTKAVDLLHALKGTFALSLGSACHGKLLGPSKVIQLMQPNSEFIEGSLRISMGIFNSWNDVNELIIALKNFVKIKK